MKELLADEGRERGGISIKRERKRERVTKVGRPEEIGRRPNLRQRRAKRLLKKEDEANGLRERHR